MLVTLRRNQNFLGRFFAVALLALYAFTQLGHYREHRSGLAAAQAATRHARHHAATRHTDITTPQTKDLCTICVLSSSSVTLTAPLLIARHRLVALTTTRGLFPNVLRLARGRHYSPSRAPPAVS
ncbi:MAG: hypothetical protein NTX57_14135 [Armatimonadetes bacterium]|nr:hypothetical protein [Armatimonadota bacterium]